MSRLPIIVTPAETRRLGAGDLPVRIGSGSDADIRTPGPVTGDIIGLIGCLDDRPFLQTTGAATVAALTVNGEPAPATRWLDDGDVISAGALRIECRFDAATLRFTVGYTDSGYATLPPEEAAAVPAGGQPIMPARAKASPGGPFPTRRRPLVWPGAAALLVLVAVAVHLFTARSVLVRVTPEEADVQLAGSLLPVRVGGRYLLRPGSYRLMLSAGGYETLQPSIEVGDAPHQEFRFGLAKLPGRLVLEGAPAVPLQVRIDGQETPAGADGSFRASAGARRLEVLAERYLPFNTTVDVEGRGERQSVVVALVPNWADVTVASEPAGARISANGQVLASTPATVAVTAGVVELELRKEGYKPWRQRHRLAAGQVLELPLVRLQESDGLLGVRSVPQGAAVTIDGRYRGTTPLEIEVTPGRAHEVLISRSGYETATRRVQVERRGSATLDVALAERLGRVRIVSEPPDASLWINGEARGRVPQELTLRAEKQKIELRKEGFVPFVTEVTPKPGLTQVVEARLLTPEAAVLASVPQTLTTSQGLVMRLIGPGEMLMGAARGEQGRRANEGQRQVRITRRFYLGAREISNREFTEFKPRHTSGAEKYRELAALSHPAVMLSWEEAVSFCNWLSDKEGLPPAYERSGAVLRLREPFTTGYRLPTEAEWEWAARYNGGGGERRYPWGGQMPPAEASGNYADQSAKGIVANVLSAYDDGHAVTAPVGSFRASPLGLFDLGGNAAEWVHDFYTIPAATPGAVAVDPVGPASGQYHVIRGSGWRSASISELRLAYRDFGDQGRLDVGFRIARYAE